MREWLPIETAPKDGTKVDLLYPYPRSRAIDCEFRSGDIYGPDGGWFWLEPRWKDGELLPESEWNTGCYPNMQPTHWMPVPAAPARSRC